VLKVTSSFWSASLRCNVGGKARGQMEAKRSQPSFSAPTICRRVLGLRRTRSLPLLGGGGTLEETTKRPSSSPSPPTSLLRPTVQPSGLVPRHAPVVDGWTGNLPLPCTTYTSCAWFVGRVLLETDDFLDKDKAQGGAGYIIRN
jgi:hypothetical protein